MSELSSSYELFEQNHSIETEQKFLPLFPDKVSNTFAFQGDKIISQIYLSHPTDNYNLRIRQTKFNDQITSTATLKDRGKHTESGLQRLELNGNLPNDYYNYYASGMPYVNKIRATPYKDIVIDFYPDGHIQLESEHPESWRRFLKLYDMEKDFIEITGDRIVDNEWRAHVAYLRHNKGNDHHLPVPDLDVDKVCSEIMDLYHQKGTRLIIPVSGRSGSGKSTFVKKLQKNLFEQGLTSNITSTDDYNIGEKRLHEMMKGNWINYDSNVVYDLDLCHRHIGRLALGHSIPDIRYNFKTGEPIISGEKRASDINFIEGIKALHPLIKEYADITYTVPTSLALSIGRRIMRDIKERPRFLPEENLSYYLEYTEPEYRALL